MNVEHWVALAGLAVMVVGWFIRLERRFGKMLTREEHDQNCDVRNERLEKKLDNIDSSITAGITGTHRRIDDLYRDLVRDRSGGR